ncbi:MAG: 6-carboxytetrahydropterin synthase [Cyclobacteriaceae bacterium]|nr:6-carboxytetrahydropterin synthase [Cyclobacteriaceae bacterium]MCX7638394.1 6-carboxytetrahydropterin synthase [Cyclobacteriaceae bacterium]MDW8330206.1 6-carboxytetrahydropterin synthase [Cyclobacteriaceae bacterium]
MLSVTKIFRFEAAHVIHGYPGKCSRIHGHSYELHVTVGFLDPVQGFIPGTGMVMDFADLKKLVNEKVINRLDHKFIVSHAYLSVRKEFSGLEELVVMDAEPTAENLLEWLNREISTVLPQNLKLQHLRLYETKDSFAEWRAK